MEANVPIILLGPKKTLIPSESGNPANSWGHCSLTNGLHGWKWLWDASSLGEGWNRHLSLIPNHPHGPWCLASQSHWSPFTHV